MSDLTNRWFARAARVPGARAYGLRYPDGQAFSNTWEARFPEVMLNELWNRLMPMVEMARGAATPESLRWTFRNGLVLGAARLDGPVFFVLATKKAEELDATGLNRLLSEFRALRG